MAGRVEKIPNEATLLEIISFSKKQYGNKTIAEMREKGEKFRNFQGLLLIEYHVRILSAYYKEVAKEAKIPIKGEIKKMVDRFIKRDIYDFIHEYKNDVAKLRNEISFSCLIKVIKGCVEDACFLAEHVVAVKSAAESKETKQFHETIERNTKTTVEQVAELKEMFNNRMDELSTKFDNLGHNAPQLLHPAPVDAHLPPIPQPNAPQPLQPAPVDAPLPPVPQPNPPPVPAPQGCAWLVPEEECRSLLRNCENVEQFLRKYLPKLFTEAELLQQFPELSLEKQNEAGAVIRLLYPTEDHCEKLKKIMGAIRGQRRQPIFRDIGDKKGCGVTNTGSKFFYKLPASENMKCYREATTEPAHQIANTRRVSTFKVPQGDFEYILFFEKTTRYSKIQKLFSNGTLIQCPN